MAWRTINNAGSALRAAYSISTGAFALLYARRQVTDLNAGSAEVELQGSDRIAGIVSSGNGTDFYGHATVGTTWVGAQTGYVGSTVNQWTWRLIIGDGTSLKFYSAPDDASTAWTEWPDSPLTQTVFTADLLLLGGNGREGAVIDYAGIRLWSSAKTPSALVAERGSDTAIDGTGLVLDKLGTGADLASSLAAGTGTLTAGGTITLNADLPSSIVTVAPPDTTPVTVTGRLQADPLVTVEASSAGDVVSFSGEYSSISDSPVITVALKSGSTTVDTATPTGSDGSYSGSFTSVADGTYTVEASISDSETSAGMTAVSSSITVDDEVMPPAVPVITVGTVTTTSAAFSWTDEDEADVFEVQAETPGLEPVTFEHPTASVTAQASPNVQISIRVRARKNGLWSGWSEWATATTLPALPAAPTVTATTLSDTAIRIDYTAVATATEYRVYRKASPGGNRTLIATNDGSAALTYTDTDLAEGSIYYYDVSATNASGTTFSAETNATTLQSEGPGRLIARGPERVEVGREFEVVVQAVTGRGDPILEQSITLTPSLAVTGDLTVETDPQGYAVFTLTATEAGSLTLDASGADANASVAIDVADEEDAATIAARLAAAEKKSTRTNRSLSPAPLDVSAPPLELMPAESVSPLAALLNEMLLAPQMPVAPISLSEFMPPAPQQAPPSSGTQRAIEALDQAIAAQMQALHSQLQTLNKLIE